MSEEVPKEIHEETFYNVRRVRGKRKGQFVKKKVIAAREKRVDAAAFSRKRKIDAVSMFMRI